VIQELPGAVEQECISRMLQECSWFHDEHPGALRSSQEHQEWLSRSASPRALLSRPASSSSEFQWSTGSVIRWSVV